VSRYEQSRNRGSGQICLRDEAAGAAHVDAGPIVGSVAARGEDDRWRVDQPAKLLGDFEAVDVRQLHVEENEVRAKLSEKASARLTRSHRLTTMLQVSFTPTGGGSTTVEVPLRFRQGKGGGK